MNERLGHAEAEELGAQFIDINKRWKPANQDEMIGATEVELMNKHELDLPDGKDLSEWLSAMIAMSMITWEAQVSELRGDGYLYS